MKPIQSNRTVFFTSAILASLFVVQVASAGQPDASFGEEDLLTDTELAGQSGQGGQSGVNAHLYSNTTTLGAGASQNNGNNSIGDNSIMGNGIYSVTQNSGNNVIIQNNTLVNVSFQ